MSSDAIQFDARLADIGRTGAMFVCELDGGGVVAHDADRVVQTGSAFKIAVCLELCCQIDAGAHALMERVAFEAERATVTDPTVADALHLMMTLSDNAATAAIMELVGRDRIMARLADLGLTHTTVGAADVVADVQRISAGLDEYARGAGFTGWAEPFDIVAAGRYDSIERRLARLPVDEISLPHDQLGPTTTARELGSLYAMVWRDEAGPPRACAAVREAASDQQLKRIDTGAAGVTVAGKGGSIPGIINNDIGVLTYPDGRRYVAAVFTRATTAFAGQLDAGPLIGTLAAEIISTLR